MKEKGDSPDSVRNGDHAITGIPTAQKRDGRDLINAVLWRCPRRALRTQEKEKPRVRHKEVKASQRSGRKAYLRDIELVLSHLALF